MVPTYLANWTIFISRNSPQFVETCHCHVEPIAFFSLSGGPLVQFWWCLEDQDPQMRTFGLSACRVKPWRPKGRKNENCGGRGKKSEILGGLAEGGPAESGPSWEGPSFFSSPSWGSQHRPKMESVSLKH